MGDKCPKCDAQILTDIGSSRKRCDLYNWGCGYDSGSNKQLKLFK